PFLERDNKAYQYFLDFATQVPQAAGIIINTLEFLESEVVRAISDGLCVPDNPTPLIYCIGKLLLTQKPSLSIHILITTVPYDSGSTAPYIANVAATIPSIKFHHLPTVTLPSTKTTHHEELAFEVLRLSNPHVREQLLFISKNYTIHGLVVDFFCCAALSVAKELNIPGYHFFTSGAEQRLNRIFLVEEMKLALPMNESDNGFVSSAEVEERVLGLMESEEGKLIRERTIAMKIAAEAALNEGGSSRVALSKLVESWKDK
ncbi:hypothetical protein D5086_008309, partial [Populus alba]